MQEIAALPLRLREAVGGLDQQQLDTPYRPGGWTVRQVVHHLADSHMNAFSRFRLALTEPEPTIKPYDEKMWAELADSRESPVEVSVALLEFLHLRWEVLLRSLQLPDFARTLRHPAVGVMTVDNQPAVFRKLVCRSERRQLTKFLAWTGERWRAQNKPR